MAPKNALSPAELRFFTEPDGIEHIGIAAVEIDAQGREGEGVGIGHLLRLPREREVAELALAVAGQGQGLGRRLLARLITAAREGGIERIRFHFLADNARMRQLVGHEFGEVNFTRDGKLLTGEFPIPRAVDAPVFQELEYA